MDLTLEFICEYGLLKCVQALSLYRFRVLDLRNVLDLEVKLNLCLISLTLLPHAVKRITPSKPLKSITSENVIL